MKQLIILLFVLHFTVPAWNQAGTTDEEDEAIMAVIEKETQSFFMGEYEDWKSCWEQTEDIYFEWVRSNVHHFYTDWSNLDRVMRPIVTENVSKNDAFYAQRSNIRIMRDGSMAWVSYQQDLSGDMSNEQRVLQKKNGEWRIVMVTVVASETFPEFDSQ